MVLRIVDIYVLRLDELLGEIVLSKSLGFALVVGYVWWVGRRLPAIGLHTHGLGPALAIGAGLTVVAFVVATAVQVLTLAPDDSLILLALDPKTGMTGGAAFAAFLIVGNVVNGVMEEGLFRGIMLTHFLQRMRFRTGEPAAGRSLRGLAPGLARPGLPGRQRLRPAAAGDVRGRPRVRLPLPAHRQTVGARYRPLPQQHHPQPRAGPDRRRGAAAAVVMSVVVVVAMAFLAYFVKPIATRLALPPARPWGAPHTHR